MKKALLVVLAVALSVGCVQQASRQPTSTLFVSTSIKPTTTVRVSTTILPESTITTLPKTTTISTTTTILSKCGEACVRAGYVDGVCRKNSMECRLNTEVHLPRGDVECARMKGVDTCCCQKQRKNSSVSVRYCPTCR